MHVHAYVSAHAQMLCVINICILIFVNEACERPCFFVFFAVVFLHGKSNVLIYFTQRYSKQLQQSLLLSAFDNRAWQPEKASLAAHL